MRTATTVSVELDLQAEGTLVPYVPARRSGDPSDCYPAEGGYCEDVRVTLRANGLPDLDITDYLTARQMEVVQDELTTAAEDEAEALRQDAYYERALSRAERNQDYAERQQAAREMK